VPDLYVVGPTSVAENAPGRSSPPSALRRKEDDCSSRGKRGKRGMKGAVHAFLASECKIEKRASREEHGGSLRSIVLKRAKEGSQEAFLELVQLVEPFKKQSSIADSTCTGV